MLVRIISTVLLLPTLSLARYKIYRNATIPVRLDDIDCQTATYVGDPKVEDLSDERCKILCNQDCQLYHSKEEMASCFKRREAMNCLFEWYEGYSILGRGCDDSKPGYFPLMLNNDPEFGLHAAMSERAMAWVELLFNTNVETPGNSDCVSGSPGYMSVWPQSKLRWDSRTNQCVGADKLPIHYEAGYMLNHGGLVAPILRHDYSYTLGFNITNWIHRAGNTLEGQTVVVLQANQCWGTYKQQPGLGGIVVQKRRPLTDFTLFLKKD